MVQKESCFYFMVFTLLLFDFLKFKKATVMRFDVRTFFGLIAAFLSRKTLIGAT